MISVNFFQDQMDLGQFINANINILHSSNNIFWGSTTTDITVDLSYLIGQNNQYIYPHQIYNVVDNT